MRWRLAFVGALLVCAATGAACSTTVTNQIVAAEDGGADHTTGSPVPPAPEAPLDGGQDAPADVAVEGACGNANGPTDTTCNPQGQCDDTGCPGGFLYFCAANRPEIDGCRFVKNGPGSVQWCCPPSCLRVSAADGDCIPDGGVAYSCPVFVDGGGLAAQPKAGCTLTGNENRYQREFCCQP